jgi:hypothetical protein
MARHDMKMKERTNSRRRLRQEKEVGHATKIRFVLDLSVEKKILCIECNMNVCV